VDAGGQEGNLLGVSLGLCVTILRATRLAPRKSNPGDYKAVHYWARHLIRGLAWLPVDGEETGALERLLMGKPLGAADGETGGKLVY